MTKLQQQQNVAFGAKNVIFQFVYNHPTDPDPLLNPQNFSLFNFHSRGSSRLASVVFVIIETETLNPQTPTRVDDPPLKSNDVNFILISFSLLDFKLKHF